MEKFKDILGDYVYIDEDVKTAVFSKHPEIVKYYNHLKLTLMDPDLIKRSKKVNVLIYITGISRIFIMENIL